MKKLLFTVLSLTAIQAQAGAIYQHKASDVLFEQFYCQNLPLNAMALWFVDEGTHVRTTAFDDNQVGHANLWKMDEPSADNKFNLVTTNDVPALSWSTQATTLVLVDHQGTLMATFLGKNGEIIDECEGNVSPR